MTTFKRITIPALVLNSVLVFCMVAQDYNVPLRMEGLNHVTNNSVISNAMGGVTIPLQKDVTLMFANPASLSTLEGLTVSVSASQAYTSANQTQQWQPDTYFGNFTLLMDGSTLGISHTKVGNITGKKYPGDTLWTQYDNIDGAHWNHDRNSNNNVPDIFIGMPFKIKGIKASVGVGYAEYANMDYYYQNNNVVTPEYDLVQVGTSKTDSVQRLDWSQAIHNREGILHSYGGAISVNLTEKITLGAGGRMITGSTDDYDASVGRGVIYAFSSAYANIHWGVSNGTSIRVDSVRYTRSSTGTSDYDGYEASISAAYKGKDVTVGVTVFLPSTITRTYNATILADTGATADFSASSSSSSTFFSTDMNLPVHGKAGIGLQLRPNVYLAAEYEYLPYGSAELVNNQTGVKTNPWLDGYSFHFGIAWNPVEKASLYFGYRKASEVFSAQYSAYSNDPVTYNAYSVGVGIHLMRGLEFNAAYEFYEEKYEDTWVDNTNINTYQSQSISAGLQYTFH